MTSHTIPLFHRSLAVSAIVAWSMAVLLLIGGLGLPLAVQAAEEYECPDKEVCRNTEHRYSFAVACPASTFLDDLL